MTERHTIEVFDLCRQEQATIVEGVAVFAVNQREPLDLISGAGDVAALAAPVEHPFQVVSNSQETVVATGEPRHAVAWFPVVAARLLVAHPHGRAWAVVEGNNFQVFTLEGTFRAAALDPT
jgi:hypothetical protein